MEIAYREAVGSDAGALLLHLKTVGDETDNLSFDGSTFNISEEREARFIERFAKSGDDLMLVATVGDRVVGNAIVERNRVARYRHRAEISLTVVKEFWGMGVGTRLMEMMVEFARKVGIEILYLEARADNERALSLYRRFGFERVGVYKSFFKINGEYFDAELMTLKL